MAYKDVILSDGPKWYCPLDEVATVGSNITTIYNVIPVTDEPLTGTSGIFEATSDLSGIYFDTASSFPGTRFTTATSNSNWTAPCNTAQKITIEGWSKNLSDAFFRGADIAFGTTGDGGGYLYAQWIKDGSGHTETLWAPIFNGSDTSVLRHYVFTHDGTTATIYKNGRPLASRVCPFPVLNADGSLATNTILGNGKVTTGGALNVYLDDVAVYDYALTAAKVLSHCEERRTADDPKPSAATAGHAAARETDLLHEYYEAIPGVAAEELNWNLGTTGDTPPTDYFRTNSHGNVPPNLGDAMLFSPEVKIWNGANTSEIVVAGKVPRTTGNDTILVLFGAGSLRWNTVGKDPRLTEVSLKVLFDAGPSYSVSGDWADGEWHHIVLTTAATGVGDLNIAFKVYVDGILELSATSTADWSAASTSGFFADTTSPSFGKDRKSFRVNRFACYLDALDLSDFSDRVADATALPSPFPPDPPRGEVGGTLYI